jgi:tetratricopeptide (TPR) repeat protein
VLASLALIATRSAPAAAQLGDVAFANSGAAVAQPAFLKGLALLHNFEYERAALAFREAQQRDPGFALAYWGEAMTYNHGLWYEQNAEAARAALARLATTPEARSARAPTDREKQWLRAVEALYGAGSKAARDTAYAAVMRDIFEHDRSDPEAATFYALALLGLPQSGRDVPTYMRAAAIVEEVFREHPDHPGAAHYLIHSYDDPVHAPLGMRAARAYSRIAPDAGHAQHMTSHIFIALGMWDDVVKANETAIGVVNAQARASGAPPATCGHYNLWLEYAYLMQGRTAEAQQALEACRAAALGPAQAGHGEHAAAAPSPMLGSFITMRTRYLIDTDDWTGAVAHWTLPAATAPTVRVATAFADGFGAWRRGDGPALRAAISALADAQRALEEGAARGTLQIRGPADSWIRTAAVYTQELQGVLALLEGRREEAVAALRSAAAAEEAMPFEFGPPPVDKPTQELLGDVLLQLHRPAEAQAAYEAALRRAPLRAPSLSGVATAADAAGNAARAVEARRSLTAMQRSANR